VSRRRSRQEAAAAVRAVDEAADADRRKRRIGFWPQAADRLTLHGIASGKRGIGFWAGGGGRLTLHGIACGIFGSVGIAPVGHGATDRCGRTIAHRRAARAVLTLHGIASWIFAVAALAPAGLAMASHRGPRHGRRPAGSRL